MTYREIMEKFVNEMHDLIDLGRLDAFRVFVAHHGPRLIDRGIDLDRLHTENERLTAIVNLIEMAKERDELRDKVAELEARLK